MALKSNNSVRIIAGEYRRRRLFFPEIVGLRPTPDRVRETLFNWLGQDLCGQSCLDLFAGSGALGFEAASRGAKRVVFVEKDGKARQSLTDNCKLLAAEKLVDIQSADALVYLKSSNELFDVVFIDPPFALNLLPEILPNLSVHLRENALVYIEVARFPYDLSGWKIVRQAKAGVVNYALLAMDISDV